MLTETIRSVPELLFVNAYPNAKNILENTRRDKPDVILMDIQMPGISGIEAVQLVKNKYYL